MDIEHRIDVIENEQDIEQNIFQNLLDYLCLYEAGSISDELLMILKYLYGNVFVTLPNGMKGNIIALAIEMKQWNTVQFLLQNPVSQTDFIIYKPNTQKYLSARKYLGIKMLDAKKEDKLEIEQIRIWIKEPKQKTKKKEKYE